MEPPNVRAKKGQSTPCAKRLAEANSEQPRESTVAPRKHRLLQVKSDDSVEADNAATILLGDLIEASRAFIESNAPNARNLDV